MEASKRTEKFWDESAQIYNDIILEELNGFKRASWQQLIEQFLGAESKLRLLDVGTGPGFFAVLTSLMGHQVTAVDSSPEMLNRAQANAQASGVNVEFLIADVSQLPFEPESFDVILSRNVTWTLPHPVETFTHWFKLLKPNGKLIIFDANWNSYLVTDATRLSYQQDVETAKLAGAVHELAPAMEQEGDAIALTLPLTYEVRPEWDLKVLKEIGFEQVVTHSGFDHLIHSESERLQYQSMPMFGICATKA